MPPQYPSMPIGPGPWAQAHASGIYIGEVLGVWGIIGRVFGVLGGIGGVWGGYWGYWVPFQEIRSGPFQESVPFRSKKSVPFHNPMWKTVPFRSLYIPVIRLNIVGGTCIPSSTPCYYFIFGLIILYLDLFEGVSVTTVILAPGVCGGGLRAALLDAISPSPVAPVTDSKNGQNATIRVT